VPPLNPAFCPVSTDQLVGPAALMTGVQLGDFGLHQGKQRGAAPPVLVRDIAAQFPKPLAVASSSSALSSAAESLATISFGVPLGANNPFQADA